jgi:hypothetical protein
MKARSSIRAWLTRPPALRMTTASPVSSSRKFAGSVRGCSAAEVAFQRKLTTERVHAVGQTSQAAARSGRGAAAPVVGDDDRHEGRVGVHGDARGPRPSVFGDVGERLRPT